MKKLIVISVVFALMIAASIWEIVYTSDVYGYMLKELTAVEETMFLYESTDNDETRAHMDNVMDKWEGSKEILFCLGNHTILRAVDEKLVSLKTMVNIDYLDDAKVIVGNAISLVEAISNDAHPVLTNLL